MLHQRERQQFLESLAARGARVTRERMALFDEIFTHHGHIDAEELLERMRRIGAKISRATVYRNLDLLVDCGLVHKHRLGRNRYLYEHVHGGQRHDHLVCTGCGRVVEFVSPGIEALQAEICRAHGFDPATHTLQISSVCRECGETAEEGAAGAKAEEAEAVEATAHAR